MDKRVCSFCNEEVSPTSMGEHLMMCGNKTDECPNCHKFIRRAIFVYHYENNCANLDEPEVSTNNASQSSSGLATGDNNYISSLTVNLKTHPEINGSTSQESHSATKSTVECSFCQEQCDLADLIVHEDKCLKNPVNIAKRQQSHSNGTANQNTDRLYPGDQLDETTIIPCEICEKSIPWRQFGAHINECARQHDEQGQNRQRGTHAERNIWYPRCRYCNEESFPLYIKWHELWCIRNPRFAAPVNWQINQHYRMTSHPAYFPHM